MPRRTMPPDAEEIVGQHWPYDGPRDGEKTEAAAAALAELVRYLNNATQYRNALPYAATAYRVVARAAAAIGGMDQLLAQLVRFLEKQAEDQSLYDDRRSDKYPAETTALLAAEHLMVARRALDEAHTALAAAATGASHLGNNEQER